VTKTRKSIEKKKAKSARAGCGEAKGCCEKPDSPNSVEPSKGAPVDRRARRDRRGAPDRRVADTPVAVERRKLRRRVKVNRRRQIDPTTCERDYSLDEIEFMSALDEYKRTAGRMFPTCSEILEVLRKLGYEKRPPVVVPQGFEQAVPGCEASPARQAGALT